jgi:tetratricopeptide (TPR) repeat protein
MEAQPDAALQRDWLLAAGYYLQGESRFPEALKLFEDAERRGATPEVWLALGSVAEERWTWPVLGGVPPPEAPPIGSPTLSVLQERTGRDRLAREAISYYEKALRADPRQFEAQLRRGRLLGVLGKTAEAEADLAAVVKSAADPYLKSLAHLFLGRLAEKGQDAGAAAAHYRAALQGRPSFQAAQLALSHALRRAGRLDEAASAARSALQPRPPGPGGPRVQDLEEPWISYQLGLAWRLPGALAELRRKVQS